MVATGIYPTDATAAESDSNESATDIRGISMIDDAVASACTASMESADAVRLSCLTAAAAATLRAVLPHYCVVCAIMDATLIIVMAAKAANRV